MKPGPKWQPPALTLIACALLLSGCAAPKPPPPVVVTPPRIPPLPQEAKQPEPPPICRPTCSSGLAKLLESWLNSRTSPASPG